jgi:Cellulose binding domain
MVTAEWLGWLARHWRYTAIGTGTCAAAAVSGVLIFMPHQAGRGPHIVADNCGIVTCTATLPPAASTDATPIPRPTRSAVTPHATLSPSPSPFPRPSATAAAAPPSPSAAPRPAPSVTVTYSVVERWDGGFQGQFTIVNHTSAALTGWQISATFPGDLVDSVWGASGQAGGSSLVLDAPSYQATIPPGASQSANFTAQGNTTSPASCTIDGRACG